MLKLQLNEINGALVVYKDVNQEIVNDSKRKEERKRLQSSNSVLDENQILGTLQNRRIDKNKDMMSIDDH